MFREGYIKFHFKWRKTKSFRFTGFEKLNTLRQTLFRLGFIGAYKSGIGFGNVSARVGKSSKFIITGSATGKFKRLSASHYTRVISCDFKKNWLKCIGPIAASSESLSHAAIYESDPSVKIVAHLHNLKLWKKLLRQVPTTSKKALYGTPEMAKEIKRLMRSANTRRAGIIVMAGHLEGVLLFASNWSNFHNSFKQTIIS